MARPHGRARTSGDPPLTPPGAASCTWHPDTDSRCHASPGSPALGRHHPCADAGRGTASDCGRTYTGDELNSPALQAALTCGS